MAARTLPVLLCLASYFKGVAFLEEARAHARTLLVTRERTRGEAWPRDVLDACLFLPDDASDDLLIDAVAGPARQRGIDRIVALEEYDVMRAALLREHFGVDGMSWETARRFRDKLAMRRAAAAAGVTVPPFTALVPDARVAAYLEDVGPPWVLKPRFDVSAMGIRVLHDAGQLWDALRALDARENPRERTSYFLLEQFVAGDVFHVDSIVDCGRVLFAGAHRYGRPPLQVAHHGGVFLTATVTRGGQDERVLLEMNAAVLRGLGHERGVAHAEFIKGSDGRWHFLEAAARVGGAFIAETLEAATGLNLWREWARLEATAVQHAFQVAAARHDHAGLALTLARQEWPETSAYDDPEITHRIAKRHHAGLIVRSPDAHRVRTLLDDYARRFVDEFCAVVAPLERPP